MSGEARREEITARIAADTGITEAMIEQLVRGFYAKGGRMRCWGRSSRRRSPTGNRI